MSAAVEIRKAVHSDARSLTAIAHAAKRYWGYSEEWIRLWRNELTIDADCIDRQRIHCAVRADAILGFYGVSVRRMVWELEHMWVDPRFMGEGIGRKLFDHACDLLRSEGARSLRIAADPNAERFYRRMGAWSAGTVSSRPAGRELPLLILDLV